MPKCLGWYISLTATILRRRITGALQSLKISEGVSATKAINQSTLYTYPTVDLLTAFLVDVVSHSNGTRAEGSQVAAIEEMINKYSFSPKPLDNDASAITIEDESGTADRNVVVLLTGSTGNLGSQVLEDLLLDSAIHRVFTLNRASSSSKSQLDRHSDRFRDKGLDLNVLQSKKWTPLEGDLALEGLGLSEAVYKEVRFATTHTLTIFSSCFLLLVEGRGNGYYSPLLEARLQPFAAIFRVDHSRNPELDRARTCYWSSFSRQIHIRVFYRFSPFLGPVSRTLPGRCGFGR